jgi:Flp pilus assembly secretin CpaC
LGDLPYVGLLFRHDSKNRNKSNLMVFLTPTIVQDEDFQPTKTDFFKTPVPTKDSIEEDWSSWDSGKPKDWSQTSPTDETKFAALPAVNNNNNLTTVPADDQSGQPITAAPEVQAAVAAQPSKFSDIPGAAKE